MAMPSYEPQMIISDLGILAEVESKIARRSIAKLIGAVVIGEGDHSANEISILVAVASSHHPLAISSHIDGSRV